MIPSISIIIPVFNTGVYLERCISSICKQTLQDIQIIIIDDGSSKETASICDKLSETDKRIIVIHKDNEGVSIARNVGIRMSQGQYVAFVDSDDWIAPMMYEDLLAAATSQHVDIVQCDAMTVREGKANQLDTFGTLKTSCLLLKDSITPNILCEIAGSSWRGIYSRSLLEKNHIEFPARVKLSEDRIFNLLALGHCACLYYLKRPYYYRYVRKGSAVYSYHDDADTTITIAYRLIRQILSLYWGEKYQSIYQHQELTQYYGALNSIYGARNLTSSQRTQAFKTLCQSEELKKVIQQTGTNDFRARLIKSRFYKTLAMMTMLINIKYKLLSQ